MSLRLIWLFWGRGSRPWRRDDVILRCFFFGGRLEDVVDSATSDGIRVKYVGFFEQNGRFFRRR